MPAEAEGTARALYAIRPDGTHLEVTVSALPGVPCFECVGARDLGAREMRERVHAAIVNAGFEWPSARVTVAVEPSECHVWRDVDVAVAVGILAASSQVRVPAGFAVGGRLQLSGEIRGLRLARGELRDIAREADDAR